jgi:hypothetical protein
MARFGTVEPPCRRFRRLQLISFSPPGSVIAASITAMVISRGHP